MQTFLDTGRLTLRRFTADEDNLLGLDSDPEVMRYLNGGKPTSRGEIRNRIVPFFLSYYERFEGSRALIRKLGLSYLRRGLVEVECSVNGRGKRGFLRRQQVAELTAQRAPGNCHDVVAADNAGVIEAVCRSYRDFGRKAADRGGDGRHCHPRHVRPHQFSGQDHDRPGLVQLRGMDRPH
jgi:hypothetical protein